MRRNQGFTDDWLGPDVAVSHSFKELIARLAQQLSNHLYVAAINDLSFHRLFVALKLRCFLGDSYGC